MDSILEAVVGSTSDAVVTADAAGLVITWNPAAEKVFGYSEDEVLGQALTLLMPEQFRASHDAGIERVVRTGETKVMGQALPLTGLHKDGHEFPIELSLATWIMDGDRYFSGIIRDVSEREKLVDELTQSEERVRAIMNSANDAIICADELGNVVLWNPAAAKMLGHSEQDMVGQPLTVIIPERYRDAHDAGIARIRMKEEPRVIGNTVELNALHKDGREFPIELSLGTWLTGDNRYFSGIIRDITDRKQAEADIQLASRALDEKNQELEALSVKLAKYLSKQVYDSIFSGRKDVRVESYRKNLTVFFSDIQGFTELTDSMEAETLSDLLNRYLSEMSSIAEEHGGTIDKFIGDGIMIFFGDPESQGEKEDALACVKMALAMRKRIHELREEWIDQGISDQLHVRIGVNTGFCTVGNFGSEDRMDYTIVGGQVNATSRLETAAEPDQILMSHATYALVKDEIYCQPIGEITVKGIAHPLKTYEAVSTREDYLRGVKPISDVGDGFRVALDPMALAPEERQRAKESLRKALEALDELSE
jgi:PAS domain S-box-containing protein